MQVVHGTFVGTGAAQNISLGFVPDSVFIINKTDGDESWDWDKTTNITTRNNGGALATQANGVSAYNGSSTPGSEASPGFTAGTNIAENGDTFFYRAFRSGPGKN